MSWGEILLSFLFCTSNGSATRFVLWYDYIFSKFSLCTAGPHFDIYCNIAIIIPRHCRDDNTGRKVSYKIELVIIKVQKFILIPYLWFSEGWFKALSLFWVVSSIPDIARFQVVHLNRQFHCTWICRPSGHPLWCGTLVRVRLSFWDESEFQNSPRVVQFVHCTLTLRPNSAQESTITGTRPFPRAQWCCVPTI